MTRPLDVDVPALKALSRELAAFGDELERGAVVHESGPAIEQPTGAATALSPASTPI